MKLKNNKSGGVLLKTVYKFSILFSITLCVFISSCSDSSDNTITPNDPNGGSGTTQSVTSDQRQNIEFDGFRLEVHAGDVPRNSNGTAGTVAFSLNTSSTTESGIPSVPSGFTVISKYLKAGPESFNLNSPVQLFFPAASQNTPQDLAVLKYSEAAQEWKLVPTSALDTANRKVGIDQLSLGYYVLVKQNFSDNATDFRQGGAMYDCPPEPFMNYILTVQSVSPEKPSILSQYSGGLIGQAYMNPIFLGCPIGKTKAIVPQGSISFWVTRSNCQANPPVIETYSIPAPVTVPDPLEFIGWSTYDAVTYVPFCLPAGGSWVAGRPENWPQPTVPVGTGTFQATLTWLNTASNATDLDLHLYGPDNLHIFWSNTSSANFSLDRDWQSQTGNAIENIFSTTATIPLGNYRVNVVHFSGFAKSFNCRVIVNGSVTNYSGNLGGGSVDVRTFTIQ
ncbi:MAG TPA: hypothetical protein PK753_06790 [Ignavibacteria bacterium]|nr:hypothetical protein [Ignavibacteria bacterium]